MEESDKLKIAQRIVKAIEEDILDRRGLKHELRQCDLDVREEIRREWKRIILRELTP